MLAVGWGRICQFVYQVIVPARPQFADTNSSHVHTGREKSWSPVRELLSHPNSDSIHKKICRRGGLGCGGRSRTDFSDMEASVFTSLTDSPILQELPGNKVLCHVCF